MRCAGVSAQCPSFRALLLQIRFGVTTACTLNGPVPEPSGGQQGPIVEDPSDCSINLAADLTPTAVRRLNRVATMCLPPVVEDKAPTPVARVRKFR